MTQTIYPEVQHVNQTAEVLRLILERGSLTHTECEEATAGKPCGKITTIRSRIPDLKFKWHWPMKSVPESHGRGSHARYSVDMDRLSEITGVPMDDLKRAISFCLYNAIEILDFSEFEELARKFRTPLSGKPIQPDLFNDDYWNNKFAKGERK